LETRKMIHSRGRRSNKGPIGTIGWICFFLALSVTIWFGYWKYMPSSEQAVLKYDFDHPIFYNGEEQQHGAIFDNKHIKLPLPLLDEVLKEHPIYYEKDSQTLVLTTMDKVLRFKTESLNALLNEKSYELTLSADVIDDVVYLPAELIEELYGIIVEASPDSHIIMLYDAGLSVETVNISREKGTVLRSEATIKSSYIDKLTYNQSLKVWGNEGEWLLVQTDQGSKGYVKKAHTESADMINYEKEPDQAPPLTHNLQGKKINLTWEAIYNRQPNLEKMPAMEGLNVVSPTWFEIVDDKGTIQGKASLEYTNWAHDRGYEIWALFSNGFEPEQTSAVLASAEKRFFMIQQLMAFAQLYKVQGINIDFENVYTKDKENLVQFVRELTPLMHELGLVVSIDVTPKSTSELWSMFLDREALGKTVDYMMLMAYDEHWAASPKSGSVASLPWVEKSISRILEEDEVPSEKLILGIPLYTRVWTEQTQADGTIKVSSKSIGMEKAKEIIAEHQLTPTFEADSGQNYVEYEVDGVKQRIWLEDETSITARIDLVHKYNLGGIATWQRAFQTPAIWKVIEQSLFNS